MLTLEGWTEAYRRGDHAVQIYSSEKERLNAVHHILQWMKEDEVLFYFSDNFSQDSIEDGVDEIERTIKKAMESGRMRVCSSQEFYCPKGVFKVEERLKYWHKMVSDLKGKGFPSIIVVGDLSWATDDVETFSKVIRYEAQAVISGLPKGMTALCQYDARRMEQSQIDYMVSVHELQIKEGLLERNFWLIAQSFQ